MTPSLVFSASWTLWAISWVLAAAWSSETTQRQPFRAASVSYVLIATSILAPILWRALEMPAPRWWDVGPSAAYILAVSTIPGFAFCWWARLHLGALWSAAIVCKADHRLIESGPYALARHPIYTGILWSALVTDIAGATIPAMISFVALASGFWLKAGMEERFLADRLGSDIYARYRRRVPRLVPFSRP